MERFVNIRKFNKLWNEGTFTIPVVILIGGAAGTGKTTLAQRLKEDIAAMNVLGTPVLRNVLKLFITPEENPYLYKHTFDLYPGRSKNIKSVVLLEKYFEMQCEPIMHSIEKFINFIVTERQNYIIEGSNITPKNSLPNKDIMLIEFFLSVSQDDEHRRMFSGPTHNREISDNKFENLRLLNNYIIEQARKNKKKVFTSKSNYLDILTYIDEQVGMQLKKYYFIR